MMHRKLFTETGLSIKVTKRTLQIIFWVLETKAGME